MELALKIFSLRSGDSVPKYKVTLPWEGSIQLQILKSLS